MDRAECRTQDAEFSGPQILGSRVLCHDRRSERGGDPGLYPKPRTGRSAIGSVRAEDLSRPKSKQSSKHPLKPPLAVPNQTSSFAGGYWLDIAEVEGRSRLLCRAALLTRTYDPLDRSLEGDLDPVVFRPTPRRS